MRLRFQRRTSVQRSTAQRSGTRPGADSLEQLAAQVDRVGAAVAGDLLVEAELELAALAAKHPLVTGVQVDRAARTARLCCADGTELLAADAEVDEFAQLAAAVRVLGSARLNCLSVHPGPPARVDLVLSAGVWTLYPSASLLWIGGSR